MAWIQLKRPTAEGFNVVRAPLPELAVAQTVTSHEGAILTPFSRTLLEDGKRSVCTGAVYTKDGELVRASQRQGGLIGDHVRSVDPEWVDPVAETELTGTWLYLGHWMAHFGHFLTETLTTMWPQDLEIDGVVAHRFLWNRPIPTSPQMELATAAGYPQRPTIVADVQTRVERLLVPTRPYVTNGVASPEAVSVFDRVADHAPRGDASRIFVSRARFHRDHLKKNGRPHKRSLVHEDHLDALMAEAGFTVVYPEELSALSQVGIMAGASVIAGLSGTGLHLAAFAGEGTRVLELGDARTPAGLSNQHVIAAARGHRYLALPSARTVDGVSEVDLDVVATALSDLHLKRRWSGPRLREVGRMVVRQAARIRR